MARSDADKPDLQASQNAGSAKSNYLIAALTLCAILGFGLHQGARLLDMGSGPYSADPYAIVGVAAGGFTCLYVAVLAYLGKIDTAWPLFFTGMACSLGRLALLELLPHSDIVLLAAQVACGAGWVLIILCWMQIFASYRPSWSAPMIAGGFLLLTLSVPAVSLIAPAWRYPCFVATLVASFAFLAVCLKYDTFIAKRMMTEQAPTPSMRPLALRTARAAVAVSVFAGLSGFVIQFDLQNGLQYSHTAATSLIGALIAFSILVWILSMKISKIVFDTAFALCSIAFILAIAFRVVVPDESSLAGSIVTMLLHAFFCFLWIAFTREAHERQLPGFFLLGLTVGCAQLAIALGRGLCLKLGAVALAQPTTTLALVIAVLAIALCLLYGICMFCQQERVLSSAPWTMEGSSPVVAIENGAPVALLRQEDAVAHQLVSRYGLSARESEIVVEFSTGRSARAIADAHLISEHTVKTHIKRAYTKLGVHSRQELLDLTSRISAGLAETS